VVDKGALPLITIEHEALYRCGERSKSFPNISLRRRKPICPHARVRSIIEM